MAIKVQGFPKSSNEHEKWVAQGRTFSGGSWYEPETTPPVTPPATTPPATTPPVTSPATAPPVAPVATPAPTPAPVNLTVYKIQPGDTLSAIAARQGTTVAALMAANPQIKDPNKIYAGQSLNLPGMGAVTPPTAPPVTPPATTPPATPPVTPPAGAGTTGAGTTTLPTPEEIAGMTEAQKLAAMQEFAKQGIPWDTVQAYFQSQTPTVDPNKFFEDAAAKYGLEDLETKINTNPTQTFEEIVTSIYDTLELPKLKTEIDDLRAKIAKAEADRDEAVETINDNPWLSEASRVGRAKKVQDKADNELNRLQNQLTLTETLYTRGQDEAKDVATRALNQYAQQREWDSQELDRLTDRAIAEAQAKYETAVASGVSDVWRYFPEYAKGLTPETAEVDTQVVEVGGRKKLINTQTGETIKDLGASDITISDKILSGKKITPDQLTPLAKAIYDGTIKLSDITPSQRANIAPELNAVGYTSTIDAETKEAVSYIKNQMPNVLEKWKAIPNNLKGLVQGWATEKAGGGLWSKEIAEFNAAAKIVGMQLTRLYEKGRISDQDRIFYLSIMPNIRMNEEAAKAGSDELIRLLEEKLTSQVNELKTESPAESSGGYDDYLNAIK